MYDETDKILGCHFCPKRNITEVGIKFAYRKVIRNVLERLDRAIPKHPKFHYKTEFQSHEPELEEDGVKEDSERSYQRKKHKRIRSVEVHNHNERLRRQRFKDKMKALQELIPNCSKMMAMGAGYSTFNYPQTMTPSPAPFLQTIFW